MKNKSKITLSIIILILVIGLVYYFFFFQKNQQKVSRVKYEQSNAEILRRLTAPLDTQSGSTDIVDISNDLAATDFSVLTEGLSQ